MRGVALSIPAGADQDLDSLKPWVHRVLQVVLDEPSLSLINVNLPRAPRGMIWTRVSVRQYDGRIVPTKDPKGRELYWFTVKPLEGAEECTDRWAAEQNWISLTPLRLDLTDHALLRAVEQRHPLDHELAEAISSNRSSPQAEEAVRSEEAAQTPS
jgi:5'-nucleotidase